MIKVLIVDDKAENLYLLKAMLDSNGFKTISAKNGAEALGLMRNNIPDLIIADILMPVMDGFTLCRECKKDEQLKSIPFFFYTATYIDPKDEEYALSLGADRFLLKPQEPDVFLKIIDDFLIEVSNKSIHPKVVVQEDETVILKEYNEVLIRKIEDKMLQSEKAEKELKRYSENLEKEILERQKNVASLQKSEEFIKLLFSSSPIGLVLCKMDGTFVDTNPAFAKIIGRSIEETLRISYWDLTPEKYFQKEKEQLKILEETGKYGLYEKEYLHKDGHLVPVLLQGLILHRDGERLIWSTVEDITERKKAESELQISQHLFQTLAEVSPVGIFRTTNDGETIYVNPSWSKLSGLSLEEAKGSKWLDAVHPEDRAKVIDNWKFNISSIKQSNAEYRFLRKDKSVVWVMGNAVPELINNEINGYIGTITDITRIKQFEIDLINAKDKAEESDRLKTAFLQNISHEVRTPMNAIIGFSDLIVDPDLTPDIRNEFIQTIVQSSNQLLSIITQIISIATIEAGQEKIYEKEISLNVVFKMIFEQFSAEAVRKNISFRYETALPDNDDKVRTDETKFIQVISNLLSNALKFIKNGSVNFGYVVEGEFLEFYVKDTGIGISADMHDKIFERFRQVESTLAREYEGSGLGLSISKAYVELLGGKIWLTSGPGEGSVFKFTIPYLKKGRDKKTNNLTTEKPGRKLEKHVTILITEDVDNNFLLLEQYLANLNIKILRAKNGQEAVEICQKNRQITLVLMDLKMPVMDGFEATEKIKLFRPDLVVIAQTAYARDTDRYKAIESGCIDFITKPYKKEDLLAKIMEHLAME
jgi:PAS domain S-box-containing protein